MTWAAILEVLTQRRGSSTPVEEETPGWTGDVRTLSWNGNVTRVAIDEEGDAALFCADSKRLVDDIRSDVTQLNAVRAELERAMGEADPMALECFPEGQHRVRDRGAPSRGRWTLGDDGRIEVVLARIHHFDVGATGRLGFNFAGGREELTACVPPAR